MESETVQTWAEGLDGYTENEILKGLLACTELLSSPSLGKFKQLCRPPRPKQNSGAYKRNDVLALQNSKANTITGIAGMRLIYLIQGRAVEDFDDATEKEIEKYYQSRRPPSEQFPDHVQVIEFLAAYRSG